MNGKRKQILAHQTIDDANNSSYYQQQMEQHREMILAQERSIKTLKVELASMTLQRDAWRTTACASAIAPERAETVGLTAEQAKMLEAIANSARAEIDNDDIWGDLIDMGLIQYEYFPDTITPTGRAALAVYRASHESKGE